MTPDINRLQKNLANLQNVLDQIEFETVDVIITPYHWVMGNKDGIKAYLKSMYVKQKLDPIEEKWNNRYADEEENM